MAEASDTDPAGFVPPPPLTASDGEVGMHPLLAPLAEAQDTVARLEATAATASAAVVEGLCARVACREAAGWLAHSHTWVHPRDLALRDAGLTGSYTAAELAGRLDGEMPTMESIRISGVPRAASPVHPVRSRPAVTSARTPQRS